MTRRGSRALARSRLVWACCVVALLAPAATLGAAPGPSVAFLTFDLKSGATLASEQPDIIGRAVLPGSVMKVAAVAAALEAGTISPRTTIVCTRRVMVDGHQLTCTHPDLHRPLTAAEALTHSCNVYVAAVAARLPRAAFDRARAGLGLPPSGTASVQASALGLEGARIPPRTLALALARIGSADSPLPWKPATLDVLRRGLRGAATVGTASALGAAGIDALAKTGTVDAGGVSQGLVVGVTPSTNPTRGFALLVSGGAGMDAAALMATRLRTQAAAPVNAPAADRGARVVRVGVAQPDGTYVTRVLSLDDYVAGVIAGEQAAGSAPAALDALAIAARTYALANAGRHQHEGFDLCDLTHCQVLRASTAASRASAARTHDQYLADGQRPADVFYTASCGGFTERPSQVWPGAKDASFLPAHPDDACGGEPAWQSELTARDLHRALVSAGFKGETIRGLRIGSRTSSGRVAWLEVDGLMPPRVSGENLRTIVGRTLGWQHLRSTLFDVTRTGAGYRFRGTGAGHGVGLCVLGAARRASQGADLTTILREYYPGLSVTTLVASPDQPRPAAAPTLRLQLPGADQAAGEGLERDARRWLEETRARLGATAAPALVVRFHPTVESYQRETGSSWFTTGTTRPGAIDLLPLAVLRQRGLLESTLRHEFAHALTMEALRGAPTWMVEGVAEWAAGGERASGPEVGPGCPADTEFRAARSGEALRRLYSRARACYERERAAGRSWRAR